MPEACQGLLKASTAVWKFFEKQAESYRKAAIWWITSAKTEVTRRNRLDSLLANSVNAERVPQFTRKKSVRLEVAADRRRAGFLERAAPCSSKLTDGLSAASPGARGPRRCG
ncbi:MAG: YdeI/OmpD-associated family protein [Gemmataceae bacterium]|nr:YdeI/OmpD-associated family protein [Gemmataceae bacterium]